MSGCIWQYIGVLSLFVTLMVNTLQARMSTLMIIFVSMNTKSTFSLSLTQTIKQPFIRRHWAVRYGFLMWGVVGRAPPSRWISFLTWLLNFCLPCASLRARPGAWCQTSRPCRCVTIAASPLCVCVCLCVCVSFEQAHCRLTVAKSVHTGAAGCVCMCVCLCVCVFLTTKRICRRSQALILREGCKRLSELLSVATADYCVRGTQGKGGLDKPEVFEWYR